MPLLFWYNVPQVVPTNETLKTSPQGSISIVLSKLHRLVDRPVAIAEVGALRVAKVNPETLSGAVFDDNNRNFKVLVRFDAEIVIR